MAQFFIEWIVGALGVVGPLFMRSDALGDQAYTREVFLLSTRLSVLASVSTAGLIVIIGDRFIELWVGGDYRDAFWPMVILTCSLAVALMQVPSVSFLYASAMHRIYAYMTAGEAIANLALSLILVQSYEMVGVSLGTAIPLLVTNLILQPRYVCRALGLKYLTYFWDLGRVSLVTAASQLPLFFVMQNATIPSLGFMLIVILLYYLLCVVILSRCVLTKPDRERIGMAVPLLRGIL